MIKHLLVITLTLWAACNTYVQNKQFTLNDVISGGENYRSFYPENISNLKWIDGSNTYSYTKDNSIIVVNATNGKEKSLCTLTELNDILSESLTRIPSHKWMNEKELLVVYGQNYALINARSQKLMYKIKLPENAKNADFNYSLSRVAYTAENNLFLATPNLSKVTVTKEENPHIICGQSYHRNEFGISKGTFWSPQGNYLAFTRKDESMVANYPLMDIEPRQAEINNIKYPMAGMTSHEVTIGIYNPVTLKTIYLETGEPKDHYLTNIAWSPDESMLYIAVLNREQNHMKLNAYSLSTGKLIKTLFEERRDTYVEPEHPIVFLPEDPTHFIWQSERTGNNHLYLYATDGKLEKALTRGHWDVTQFLGFDTDGSTLFYSSTEKSPLERHTYSLSLKNNRIVCLTKEVGTHSSQIASTGDYVLDNWSNTDTPRKIDLINIKKETSSNLLTATDPYTDYQLGETKLLTLKASDGKTDLYGRMITPPNYDASKKYPVIVYVYGGPHAQLVTNRWMAGARMWQHYMAQKGYIAFTLDNRGSAGRGQKFEEVIHRQLGKLEMEDQMVGIDYLKGLPYVDSDRIGVHGWSYGGFMTTSLMTTYPETFKVGVAGGPVIDWKYYEVMYGERYMDMPHENPDGYENSSLLNKTKQLEGKLLIIHGAIDPTVVWQNSLAFVRQCVKDGVQLDYFVYPGHEHNIRGKDRVHLMQKVSLYFDDFL